jgi:hypothetical protein
MITKAVIIQRKGYNDHCNLCTGIPSPIPQFPGETLILHFEAFRKDGFRFVKENFDLQDDEIEVIDAD